MYGSDCLTDAAANLDDGFGGFVDDRPSILQGYGGCRFDHHVQSFEQDERTCLGDQFPVRNCLTIDNRNRMLENLDYPASECLNAPGSRIEF